MKIAIPIHINNGLESEVSENFGKSREFLVVNLEAKTFEITKNQKITEKGVKCKAGKFDPALNIDTVITKCIGNGSLRDMNSSGIKVYQAQKDRVVDNLKLIENGELKLFHMFE